MSSEPSILWGRNAVSSQADGHSETLGYKAGEHNFVKAVLLKEGF